MRVTVGVGARVRVMRGVPPHLQDAMHLVRRIGLVVDGEVDRRVADALARAHLLLSHEDGAAVPW